MENETKLVGQATSEKVAEWKAQYGEVYAVKVDGSICYLKKPNRVALSAMSSIASDPIKASEFLLNNCWISGDEAIKTDDGKFLGVCQHLNKLVEVKSAELEKL